MGGFIAVAQGLKIEIVQDLSGIPVINVLHARFDGFTGNSSELNSLANGIYGAWYGHLLPQQNVDLSLEEVIVTDLTDQFSPQGTHSASNAGGDSGDVLSANAALCISLRTAFRYRGGHGRCYIGGLSQDRLDTPSTWSSTTQSDFDTAAAGFLTEFNGLSTGGYGNVTLVILHARMATVHPVPPNPVYEPPFMSDVTTTNVDARVDSQRRRLGR